jgi:hypothetical protein
MSGLNLLCLESELTRMLLVVPKLTVGRSYGLVISCVNVLSKYLENESERIVLQACKAIRLLIEYYSFRHDNEDAFNDAFNDFEDIRFKWLNSFARCRHRCDCSPIQKKLLLFIFNKLQQRMWSSHDLIPQFHKLDNEFKEMSFEELNALVQDITIDIEQALDQETD